MFASTVYRRLDGPRWVITAVACWIPIAAAFGVLAFIVYAAVQQDIRQSANNPQVALAEAAAAQLSAGVAPDTVLPPPMVDMRSSLAPFVIVYDDQGAVKASSVSLDGRTPRLPSGVLESLGEGPAARSGVPRIVRTLLSIRSLASLVHGDRPRFAAGVFGSTARDGELRFTWQPASGVRAASVLTPYSGSSKGFVLAGRSLREVELLEDHIFAVVALGLAGGLAVTLAATVAVTAIATVLGTQSESDR